MTFSAEKLLLLDRDGVINEDSDQYIKTVDEWVPIPGSLEAIAELNRHGYEIIVITNQSGIGRGFFTLDTLHSMHAKMYDLLSQYGGHIKDVFFCPHTPDDGCECRKPSSGLIKQVENKYNLSVSGVPFVGDSKRDLQLAHNKECKPVLVKTGKGQAYFLNDFKKDPWSKNTLVYEDLAGMVKDFL